MTVVLALRQSPDWTALAADFARGRMIDPSRYVPAQAVPAFPGDIQTCIAGWNALFHVDFFTCRAELQAIARTTLNAVRGGLILTQAELSHRLPAGLFRLFFLDDDDWFAPDTQARMSDVAGEDVAVFPLLRLDTRVFTFVREVRGASPVIGFPNRFSHRYQTNNYALHSRLCTPSALGKLSDHITASAEAGRLGLQDHYHDVMVSVTNKTPVSASVVARLPDGPAAFAQHVQDFVASLRRIDLPSHAMWMRDPIEATASLFARACRTPSPRRSPGPSSA